MKNTTADRWLGIILYQLSMERAGSPVRTEWRTSTRHRSCRTAPRWVSEASTEREMGASGWGWTSSWTEERRSLALVKVESREGDQERDFPGSLRASMHPWGGRGFLLHPKETSCRIWSFLGTSEEQAYQTAEERCKLGWNAWKTGNNQWLREDGQETQSWRQQTRILEARLSGHASYRR